MQIFQTYGVQCFQVYRLLTTNYSNDSVEILGFDLLRQGCEVERDSLHADTRIVSTDRATRLEFTLSFLTVPAKETDGFSVKLNNSLTPAGVSFVIEGSNNGTGRWVTVGSSRFRRVRSGIRYLSGEIHPDRGQENLILDHRAPWPLVFEESWVQLLSGLFLICVSVGGAAGKIERCWTIMIDFLFFVGLNLLIVAVGNLSLGLAREAFFPASMAASLWSYLAIISYSQRHLRRGLIAQGLSVLICRSFNECVLFEDCGFLPESIEIVTLVTVFGSTVSVLVSRHVVSRAIRDVQADRVEYNRAWHPVVSRPSHRRMLKELQKVTAQLARACPSHGARQLDRRHGARSASVTANGGFFSISGAQPAFLRAGVEGFQALIFALATPFRGRSVVVPVEQFQRGVPGTCDEFRPIRCLGRLYSQALLVAECLQMRAADWAIGSSARLQPPLDLATRIVTDVTTEDELENGARGARSGESNRLGLYELIREGIVKCPKRAVEKALVCYEGDLSRVVDICRVRVVATGLQQVLAVVNAIAGDSSVRIVRIKNTMRSHHSFSSTVGFRVSNSEAIILKNTMFQQILMSNFLIDE